MDNKWARLLAYVTGLVNQELLLQNEYLAAENRILKAHLQPGFRLTDGEMTALAEIGKRLGRKALQKVAGIAKPDPSRLPAKSVAHMSRVALYATAGSGSISENSLQRHVTRSRSCAAA